MRLTLADVVWRLILLLIAATNSADLFRPYPPPPPHLGRTLDEAKDEIEQTFDLLEQGGHPPEPLPQATLILGNSGAGKSTLLQILAGDNSKLIAVEKFGNLIIVDEQDHSSHKRGPLYPKLVVDLANNSSFFYDCPGFSGTRTTPDDIAATYFTNIVAHSIQNTKLVFAVVHSSLKSGGSSNDLLTLIKSISELVKEPLKFKDSMVLVATKVENSYRKGTLVDDATLLSGIHSYLDGLKNELVESKATAVVNPELQLKTERYIEILEILNAPGKVTLSRQPEEEGPISEDALIQEGRIKIYATIENASYTPVAQNDFGYTVSDSSKFGILDLLEAAAFKSELEIQNGLNYWVNERQVMISSGRDWKEIRDLLVHDAKAIGDFRRNLDLANSTSDVAVFLRNAGSSVELDLPYSMISGAMRFDGYSNLFRLVGNVEREFRRDGFILILENLIQFNHRQRLWYGFLLSLFEFVESYEVQANREMYDTSDFDNWGTDAHGRDGIVVTEDNFIDFFDAVAEKLDVVNEFGLIKETPLTNQQLVDINQVVSATIRNAPITRCDKSSKSLTITGSYIVVRQSEVSAFCEGLAPLSINIFATSTVFITEDIMIHGEVTLSIISPKFEVIGKSVIAMQGSHNWNTFQPKNFDSFRDEWRKCVASGCDNSKLNPIIWRTIEYHTYPRPSLPGSPGGSLFMLTGSCDSINHLNLISKGGMGSVGDDGLDENWDEFSFAGVGGLGGPPGVVGVYVLDNATRVMECPSKYCKLFKGEVGPRGQFGNKKDGTKYEYTHTNQTLPKSFNRNVDYTRAIIRYKTQIHSIINPFNFQTVTNFWDQLDRSKDLTKFGLSDFFADELLSIVTETHSSSVIANKALVARYSSLLSRLEPYAQNPLYIAQAAVIDCAPYSLESAPPSHPCTAKTDHTNYRYYNSTYEMVALLAIYTAAQGQINFLQETVENNVVVDISSFLELSIKAVNEIKTIKELKAIAVGMQDLLNEYKEGIDKEIEHASSFISNSLKPSIDKQLEKLSAKIKEILTFIQEQEKSTEANIKNVDSYKKQLAENLKMKQVTGGIKLFSNFLPAVFGKVGEALQGAVNTGIGIYESTQPDVSDLPGKIEKIGAAAAESQKTLTSYMRHLPDEIELEDFFDDLVVHLPHLPNGPESFQTLKSDLGKEIAAYRLEMKKDVTDFTKTAATKNKIKGLVVRIGQEMPKHKSGRSRRDEDGPKVDPTAIATAAFDSFSALLKGVDAIPAHMKEMATLQSQIDSGSTVIKELKQLNQQYHKMKKTVTDVLVPMLMDINMIVSLHTSGQIKNISSITAYVKDWQVGKAIRTLRNELQLFITALQIEGPLFDEVTHIVEELEIAMHTVMGVKERTATFQGHKNLADLIHGLNNAKAVNKIPGRLGELVTEIETKIKMTSALWFYKVCKSAFIQHVFPFADLYNVYLPPSMITEDPDHAIGEAYDTLLRIKAQVDHQKVTINNRRDKFLFFASFVENSTIPGPFYTWDGIQNMEKITKLLSGEEVYFDANIIQSPEEDAIKFNEVNLLFKLRSDNDTLRQEFHSAMEHFTIRLTHTGNSFYRYEDKYYMISSSPLDIEYSYQTDGDGNPLVTNGVYEKLQNGDVTLSPYTLWKFAIVSKNGTFEELSPFLGSQVDLVMVGKGTYVTQEAHGEDFHLDRYYQEVKSMEGLLSAELRPDRVEKGRALEFVRKGRHVWASSPSKGLGMEK